MRAIRVRSACQWASVEQLQAEIAGWDPTSVPGVALVAAPASRRRGARPGRVWLAVDELTSLDSKRKPTVASEVLDQVVAEGRSQRIGFLWVSQNPELITPRIATNTTHFLSFQFNERKQANAIGQNFAMAQYRKDEILKLK